MAEIEIDDEDEGGEHERQARAVPEPPPDMARYIREAVEAAFAVHHLPQRAAVADAVVRNPVVTNLKYALPVLIGLGTVFGGVITIGERVSSISQRIDKSFAAAAENHGWIKAAEPRVVALEYQSASAGKERASIAAQLAQNRDALANQLDDLRKDREASNVKLGRIEGQLEDLRSAVTRLESMGRGGSLGFPWRDAKKEPRPPPVDPP